ncbi:MAG: hypothetical protein WD273_11120 [Trueperaceae bacterium]
MRSLHGFTLLEVVVAGGLLASGILALLTLQVQALEVQRRVRVVRELVGVAEGELARRFVLFEDGEVECSSQAAASPSLLSCQIIVESCGASSYALCSGPGSGGATHVSISVEGVGGQRFDLGAVHARFPSLPASTPGSW